MRFAAGGQPSQGTWLLNSGQAAAQRRSLSAGVGCSLSHLPCNPLSLTDSGLFFSTPTSQPSSKAVMSPNHAYAHLLHAKKDGQK